MYPFFDDNAKDAARFFFGSACSEDDLIWNEGWLTIDEAVDEEALVPNSDEDEDFGAPASSGPILEGSRNNTMSHFAGRILKKLGVCDKAKEAYKERARKCEPPLSEEELETIWNSAVKFYEKVASQEGYIAPDQYNDEFATGDLKPEDYSDIGEAKVIARSCRMSLRYTSATDFITFHGDRWYEDKQKSLGTVEDFLDTQLADAEDAVKQAEDALISIGVDEESVKGRDKKLTDMVPADTLYRLPVQRVCGRYHRHLCGCAGRAFHQDREITGTAVIDRACEQCPRHKRRGHCCCKTARIFSCSSCILQPYVVS